MARFGLSYLWAASWGSQPKVNLKIGICLLTLFFISEISHVRFAVVIYSKVNSRCCSRAWTMSQTLFSPKSFSSVAFNWISSMRALPNVSHTVVVLNITQRSVIDVQKEDTLIKQQIITFLRRRTSWMLQQDCDLSTEEEELQITLVKCGYGLVIWHAVKSEAPCWWFGWSAETLTLFI